MFDKILNSIFNRKFSYIFKDFFTFSHRSVPSSIYYHYLFTLYTSTVSYPWVLKNEMFEARFVRQMGRCRCTIDTRRWFFICLSLFAHAICSFLETMNGKSYFPLFLWMGALIYQKRGCLSSTRSFPAVSHMSSSSNRAFEDIVRDSDPMIINLTRFSLFRKDFVLRKCFFPIELYRLLL